MILNVLLRLARNETSLRGTEPWILGGGIV